MLRFLFLLFSVSYGLCLSGQEKEHLDQIDIYLHTFDAGDQIYTNFGHTAVRVQDKFRGRDEIYNWGLFDFRDPISFSARFYQGDLLYRLGVYPARRAMSFYSSEGRKVWEQKLYLTSEQKRLFLEKLYWNRSPKNRQYQYHYFFNNCSTKPRDYLDYALGGAISSQLESLDSGQTWRKFVREGYAVNPWMDMLLEIGMNSNIDRPVSAWDAMFHPLVLKQQLEEIDNSGQSLLGEAHLINDDQPVRKPDNDIFYTSSIFLICFSALVWLLLKKLRGSFRRLVMRLTGLVGALCFLFFGLCGLLMPLNWLFSGHVDLHHNVNIALFWPLDFLFVYLFGALLFKGRPGSYKPRFQNLARVYIYAHILVTIIISLMNVLGLLSQNLDRVLILAPSLILLYVLAASLTLEESSLE